METETREPTAEIVPIAPRRRPRDTQARFAKRLSKLSLEALDCLEEIMTDEGAKAADRISAAKLTLDVMGRRGDSDDEDGVARVIIEGIEKPLVE